MLGRQKMKTMISLFILLLCFSSNVAASDYEIMNIKPIFNEATPGFGQFKIQVDIKSNITKKTEISVSCLYIGLIHPGVYYEDEPIIMKQYKQISINPSEEKRILFDQGFRTYHPETVGEIIISIVGTGIIRSQPLKTSFHPESND